MNNLKDYVFYILLKDDDKNKTVGHAYGIKKGAGTSHDSYYHRFLDINSEILDNIQITPNWDETMRNIAAAGNVVIVNSSIEVQQLEYMLYLVYLPSEPSLYQLNSLEKIKEEFSVISIEVGVFGENYQEFLNERFSNKDFNSLEYLNNYIKINKEKIKRK